MKPTHSLQTRVTAFHLVKKMSPFSGAPKRRRPRHLSYKINLETIQEEETWDEKMEIALFLFFFHDSNLCKIKIKDCNKMNKAGFVVVITYYFIE